MVSVGGVNTTPSYSTVDSGQLTTPQEDERVPMRSGVAVEQILIVFIIIVFWFIAVVAFLRKWDSIRIMQPQEPRYKHSPKNLDTIKIVKRAQDSVIYKSYSRKMSVTMVEREKRRLQRMHTVPCMSSLPGVKMDIHRLPTIHTEEVATTAM